MMYYLAKRGLSLNQLAQLSGVSPSLLSRIKTGTRKAPGLDKVWSIITVLNIPDEEILTLFKSKVI
jgi:transcriptional regulator with XRE-family HTH domain